MDESPTLSDVVESAVRAFLSTESVPAVLTGFVLVAEVAWADAEGTVSLSVTGSDDQALNRTLGLLSYGEEWVRDDIRRSFMCEHDE